MFQPGISTTLSRSAVAITRASPQSPPLSSTSKPRSSCGEGEPRAKRRILAPLAGVVRGVYSVNGADGGGGRLGMDSEGGNLEIEE